MEATVVETTVVESIVVEAPRAHEATSAEAVELPPLMAAEAAPGPSLATVPEATVRLTSISPPSTPGSRTESGRRFGDAVTLLEIAPPESGGVRESAIATDRSQSPPSPRPARRLDWSNPLLAWPLYILIVVALTLFFIYIFTLVFRA